MARVMLPAVAVALYLGAIEVAIDIRGLVDIDIDVAAAPVAVAENRTRGREAEAPCEAGCLKDRSIVLRFVLTI
jgi:hypothetical protein